MTMPLQSDSLISTLLICANFRLSKKKSYTDGSCSVTEKPGNQSFLILSD